MNKRSLISGKTAIVAGVIIAAVLFYLGVSFEISALIALVATIILATTETMSSGNEPITEGTRSTRSFNYGGIFKAVIYVTIFLVAIYYLVPMLNEAMSGKSEKPLNNVFYVERQNGNGIVDNNGKYGIRLGVGSATQGTTFILRTKSTETGWPAFGTKIFASKEGSTLKVSYIDADNPSGSIRFKQIPIPTAQGYTYTNKYKINNARSWTYYQKNQQSQNDNINTPYRSEPIRHDIEIEVYVAPNSYVDLDNMVVYRSW